MLKDAAEAFARMVTALGGKGQERDELIGRAREDIRNAQRAITARDAAVFQESVTDAASQLADANKITFAPNIAGLGNGLVTGLAARAIDEAIGKASH